MRGRWGEGGGGDGDWEDVHLILLWLDCWKVNPRWYFLGRKSRVRRREEEMRIRKRHYAAPFRTVPLRCPRTDSEVGTLRWPPTRTKQKLERQGLNPTIISALAHWPRDLAGRRKMSRRNKGRAEGELRQRKNFGKLKGETRDKRKFTLHTIRGLIT